MKHASVRDAALYRVGQGIGYGLTAVVAGLVVVALVAIPVGLIALGRWVL